MCIRDRVSTQSTWAISQIKKQPANQKGSSGGYESKNTLFESKKKFRTTLPLPNQPGEKVLQKIIKTEDGKKNEFKQFRRKSPEVRTKENIQRRPLRDQKAQSQVKFQVKSTDSKLTRQTLPQQNNLNKQYSRSVIPEKKNFDFFRFQCNS
eukprot:TRINITY_DN21056_c0_g1_i1.p2 TRINITY_DN21056_c0_g1~~TRINITY_DN21056_c0_g1_i1.p2  ORF type:complete len:151 (-),score=33.86 TRINITY_DN21056_c0_g1_i1:453-905(-)